MTVPEAEEHQVEVNEIGDFRFLQDIKESINCSVVLT